MTGRAFPRQRGATLVVTLILLTVMSLLAVTSLRGTVLQERMSANAYDRSLAFQAAEAGLRMGERQAEHWANGSIAAPASTPGCPAASASGLYVMSAPAHAACDPLWEKPSDYWNTTGSGGVGDTGITFGASNLSLKPRYIVELISDKAACNPAVTTSSPSCRRFRITAASDDTGGRARVVLQSIYATE
ncbi:MAG: hypothetical protein LBR95_06430 [Azoarcus sp.]|jgi:type IV pilus assembly protein PilX|nr:hypothetical protein [Azoarcus sp.]